MTELDVTPELAEVLAQLGKISSGTKDLRGDTRDRLLDAAIELFATQGLGGTSIRKLSAAVGISSAGLYSHFSSKEAVLGAAMARAYKLFLEYVLAPANFRNMQLDDLLDLCRRHMEYQIRFRTQATSSDQLLAGATAEQYLDEDTHITISRARTLYFNRVRNAVAEVRGRSPLDASFEAEAILTLCDTIAIGPRKHSVDETVIDDYLTLIKRMLLVA